VIGFAGFNLQSYDFQGNSGQINASFVARRLEGHRHHEHLDLLRGDHLAARRL